MPCLGVVGTLVWDTIIPHDPTMATYEGWGGITYSLEALQATLPPSWSVLPIVKVGADLHEAAMSLLSQYPAVRNLDGLIEVPEVNNRVELRYVDAGSRRETLSGGVPGWAWSELRPLADRCDALYVNLIAGWELGRTVVDRIGDSYDRPAYLDVHSLVLGVSETGSRIPRVVADWEHWVGAFDFVQLNESELASLSGGGGNARTALERVLRGRTDALFVTRGREGVRYLACQSVVDGQSRKSASTGPCQPVEGHVGVVRTVDAGDPTGCGDVWGAVCFTSLLAGGSIESAIRAANQVAAKAAMHRGAVGFAETLASEHGEGKRT